MARKKIILGCPACQAKLLDDCNQCAGVLIVCPNCGSSVLVDIDEIGRMRLSVEPQGDRVQPDNRPQPQHQPQPQQPPMPNPYKR